MNIKLPAAILAGGLATRLRPITETIPKSLIDIDQKPFVEYQLELLQEAGIREVVMCVGYLGDQIKQVLGDGDRWKIHLTYSYDGSKLLGTGGALRHALPMLGDAFFILYGDSYLQCNYRAIEQAFYDSGKNGLMTVFHNEGQWDQSNIEFRKQRIIEYNKKNPTSAMTYIDYGVGILTARVLSAYPEGEFLDLATVYQNLIAQNDIAGYEVLTRFYEVGSFSGLKEFREFIQQRGET